MLLALTRWLKGASRKTPARRITSGALNLLRLEAKITPTTGGTIAAALGTGPGREGQVAVIDSNGVVLTTFTPYPGFTGGVNVAVGDVTGDGVLDVMTGAGPGGGPHVQVFDGAGLLGGIDRPLVSFFPYDQSFRGGVYVALGDLDSMFGGDQRDELITGPGAGGGPDTRAFSVNADGSALTKILQFNAYDPSFTGGVRVAAGEFGGDNGNVPGSRTLGDDEIVTAPGPGGGPHVKLWDYDQQLFDPDNFSNIIVDIGPGFTGGLYVSAGYFTNNRDEDGYIYEDLVVSAGAGGSPQVVTYRLDGYTDPARRDVAVYELAGAPVGINVDTGLPETVTPNPFAASFRPYSLTFGGGSTVGVIHVAASPTSGATDMFITGPGQGGGDDVRIFDGTDTELLVEFPAFNDPLFFGGVNASS